MIQIESKKVVIKSIPRVKFSGVSNYSGTGIAIEGAQLEMKSGSYKTGLTKEQEIQYCEELGLPKGTLSKNNAEYWGSLLNLRLPTDKPYIFSVETLLDQIKLNVLMQRSNIAINETDIKNKPFCEFYIDDKEAKAKVEEVIINYKMDALDAMRSLTLEEKKGYLKLYGKRGLDTVSESFVNTNLFKEVDSDPKKFLDFYNNPDIKLRIEIEDMIEAGTLIKKGNYYTFQNETIGNSVESVIAYFKDLRNQSVKLAAMSSTKAKKEGK